MLATVELFTRAGGIILSRWGHFLSGVTWIGLLYYFNFVQTPALAAFEAGPRVELQRKLLARALWWFRWGAMLTVLTGISILGFQKQFNGDYMKSPGGLSISTGILLGTDHVRQRVARHLAQPEDRHRQRRACGRRSRARPGRRCRGPQGRAGVAHEHALLHPDAVLHGGHLALRADRLHDRTEQPPRHLLRHPPGDRAVLRAQRPRRARWVRSQSDPQVPRQPPRHDHRGLRVSPGS